MRRRGFLLTRSPAAAQDAMRKCSDKGLPQRAWLDESRVAIQGE